MVSYPDDIYQMIAELDAGIVPTRIFLKKTAGKQDPFEGIPVCDARKLKRKWRKLKKKYRVKNTGICNASFVIRVSLGVEYEKSL